ncbi:MAG TPA: hypothetical protein VHI95_01555 [Acidimicrobiales bacterium]|jgi:hypothetical protein|nr:hypothetical protein [Acidimicrobiales bacterium]
MSERSAVEGSALRRRREGTYRVDEWGLDVDFVAAMSRLFALRWDIETTGADVLPTRGPVLLVANSRFGLSEPFVFARGIQLATGRFLRMAGVPDIAPVGPTMRRLGGALARPDEVAGLLRAGQIVGLTLSPSVRRDRAGAVRADLVAAALDTRADIVPVALLGRELGRRWKLIVGPAIERPPSRGPLAAAELADRVRGGVQSLLDDARSPNPAEIS